MSSTVKLSFQIISHSNLAPPSSIEITASSHGIAITRQNNKLDVKENQDLMLTCTVANSKPAAEIKWFRGNTEMKVANNRHDDTIKLDNKRFTVTSNLTIKATTNDDLIDYSCRAKHQALSPDHPMKTTVQVSVLKAPGEPYIEGYNKGERLRNGQELILDCKSNGGNPPAQLIWYKNNRQVVSQYTTSGRDSVSSYRFKVQPGDNKARLRCEASNTISDKPLKKEIDLTVLCEYSKRLFQFFFFFLSRSFFFFALKMKSSLISLNVRLLITIRRLHFVILNFRNKALFSRLQSSFLLLLLPFEKFLLSLFKLNDQVFGVRHVGSVLIKLF